MSDNQSNNKRIARNTIFLYIRMVFVLIVSLYTSRVILNTLGVEDYGVYNVVGGFVTLFGFLNATLSSSMQRFYNYEGAKEGVKGYQKVYIIGLYIHIILCALVFLILETFGSWYVNNVMVVDSDRLFAANILFQLATASMILVILEIPFTGAIMAYEKMDFYAFISIIDVVLKLIIVVFLPFLPFDKLISYGSLVFLITIVEFVFYYVYCKRKFESIKFKRIFDKQLFISLISFSGWNLLGTFAFLLKGQGLNMLLNFYFGTIINAARGIAYQVNGAINGFSANIATAFRPQIVSSYAEHNNERTKRMMFVESKICFSLMSLLMVPIAIEISYLLHFWLGDIVPEYTNIFAVLVLIDSLVCTLNTPCTQVAYAVGDLKKYQIITSVINLCLLPACWICLHRGMNAISVFVATIIFSVINQVVCLILLNKLFPFGLASYTRQIVAPCIILIVMLPIIPYSFHCILPEGIIRVLVVGIIDIVVGIVLTYYIVMNVSERNYAKSLMRSKFKKQILKNIK